MQLIQAGARNHVGGAPVRLQRLIELPFPHLTVTGQQMRFGSQSRLLGGEIGTEVPAGGPESPTFNCLEPS